MSELTAIPQDAKQQATQAVSLLELAEATEIVDQETFDYAGRQLQEIKRAEKDITAKRVAMTRPIDEAKKTIMDFFRGPLDALGKAESTLRRVRLAYTTEQERLRAAEEARLRELARKEAERLQARADAAEAKGKTEKAEDLRAQAYSIPAPVVVAAQTKTEGIATRTTYSAEVTDKAALIAAVAAGQVPDVVLTVDMKVVNAQARALKDSLNYPGVKVIRSTSEAVRT